MKKITLVILAIVLLGCDDRKYKGFESFNDFLHYKLLSIGEADRSLSDSAYIAVDYKYCSNDACSDDLPYQTAYLSTHYYPEFWKQFEVGDEFVLILDSNKNLFWMSLFDLYGKRVKWPVIVDMDITAAKYHDLTYEGDWDEEFALYREETEIALMKKKILDKGGSNFVDRNGCYLSMIKDGNGDTIVPGSEVALSYKAYFSNGSKFDDTDQWQDSMKFIFGQPLQIIEGLEKGMAGMREGSEAKLIIPSQLAFGKQGSSSGLVPPYEPLLYHLYIIEVTNSKNENQ